MKKISALFAMLFISLAAFSQIGTLSMSDELPESSAITDVTIMNPNFNNAFVFLKTNGQTVFAQKSEIFLIDSKTFGEKKKIGFPKYPGYDVVRLGTNHNYLMYLSDASIHENDRALELHGNLAFIYSSKLNKRYAISAIKLNETLTPPQQPEYLFTVEDRYDVINVSANGKKDICVFTNERVDKKLKKNTFYYRVYDNNLKLLAADSITSDLKTKDTISTLAYDDGFVMIKTNGKKRIISVHNIRNNSTHTFDVAYAGNTLTIERIRAIAGDKVVFLGSYFGKAPNKKIKSGIFKVVYNTKTNTLEDQVYFDHIPAGKYETDSEQKNIIETIITEKGACYALVTQISFYLVNKYEVMYLNSESEKWKKQVPIPTGFYTSSRSELVVNNSVNMSYSNGKLYIVYLDYEKDKATIDFNNYVYGEPKPAGPQSLREIYRSNISLLKITPDGNIQQQAIPDVYYKGIYKLNNDILGLNQSINGLVYSPCKFLRITLND